MREQVDLRVVLRHANRRPPVTPEERGSATKQEALEEVVRQGVLKVMREPNAQSREHRLRHWRRQAELYRVDPSIIDNALADLADVEAGKAAVAEAETEGTTSLAQLRVEMAEGGDGV